MNLGIDFGSTYSSFATYNTATGLTELCKPTHSESEAVPSVACLDENDQLITGHEARETIRDDDETISFEAFKMLLTEQDEDIVRSRGYNRTWTPELITQRYLDQQIRKILTGRNEQEIGRLVVCVPEVWITRTAGDEGKADGRAVIRDICSRIPGVGEVQIVSEPAAASACFAERYRKLTGKALSGHLLVIDYGGGTLDLTLTEISRHESGGADGTQSMEVVVKNRTGVGENHPGKIGDAGIAYMEGVVRLAVAESPNTDVSDPEALDPKDSDFRKAYLNLERKLKSQTVPGAAGAGPDSAEEESFSLYHAVMDCIDDIDALEDNDERFVTIRYGRTRVDVTFSQLMRAYNSLIAGKLRECLTDMADWMEREGIDYEHSTNDSFHVVVVGGFGKFILVQNQIQDFFDASSTGDRRFAYDLGENREFAVAIGAALLADRIITIKHTAPFGIGVMAYDAELVPDPAFAVTWRQEVDPDREYPVMGRDRNPRPFIYAGDAPGEVLIGLDRDGGRYQTLTLKPELAEAVGGAFDRLAEEAGYDPEEDDIGLLCTISFRMDEAENVTLLVRAPETGAWEEVELGTYRDMGDLDRQVREQTAREEADREA